MTSANQTGVPAAGALAPYRVLDLTCERGWLAGRMLADLGACVIKLEPPGGDPGRRRGPFFTDQVDPEHCLRWWFLNRGKQSVTCDLRAPAGRALFERLLTEVDLVLESFTPGELAGMGVEVEQVCERFPKLVWTSITPFGQTGPHAHFQGPDLIQVALGGSLHLTGDPERAPVRVAVPQADLHGSAEGAAASLIALYHAGRTGHGQRVDVASQLCVVRALMNATPFPRLEGRDLVRQGIWNETAGFRRRAVYACADGYLSLMLNGGVLGGHTVRALLAWAEETMEVPLQLLEADWTQLDFSEVIRNPAKAELFTNLSEFLVEFFLQHDKETLYLGALERRILLAPVNTVADIRADEQLRARGYFDAVDHGELGEVHYPGAWAKLSNTPLQNTPRAPRIGEHNQAVYGGLLGIEVAEMVDLADAGAL